MTAPMTIRAYIAGDLDAVRDVFRASIEGLTADHYDADQRAAWSGFAGNGPAFAKRLEGRDVRVVERVGRIVGFAALAEGDTLDLLYVSPMAARSGVATALCDALEACACGPHIQTRASQAALAFFETRGYIARHTNTLEYRGVRLDNTTMTKRLDKRIAS